MSKITKINGVAQVVEHLPSKYEVQTPVPSEEKVTILKKK
jgi:hypothetical protein